MQDIYQRIAVRQYWIPLVTSRASRRRCWGHLLIYTSCYSQPKVRITHSLTRYSQPKARIIHSLTRCSQPKARITHSLTRCSQPKARITHSLRRFVKVLINRIPFCIIILLLKITTSHILQFKMFNNINRMYKLCYDIIKVHIQNTYICIYDTHHLYYTAVLFQLLTLPPPIFTWQMFNRPLFSVLLKQKQSFTTPEVVRQPLPGLPRVTSGFSSG